MASSPMPVNVVPPPTPHLHLDRDPSTSITISQSEIIDERTGLLSNTEHVKLIKEPRKASSRWILPATFIFALLSAAGTTVELEVIGQMACRLISAKDPTLEPPASTSLGGTFISLPGSPEGDWALKCRANSEVQKSSTEIITSIALAAGILSALTSGYYGKVSDKYGRKPVIAISTLGQTLVAVLYTLVIAFPATFGFGTLIFSSVLGGLAGGELTAMAVNGAYLGDCAVEGSKTQVLSTLVGMYMFGLGIGPLFGSLLLKEFTSGVLLIFVAQILAGLIYLLIIPIMPESLHPSLRTHSRPASILDWQESTAKDESIFVRLAKVPAELVKPFKVLLPKVRIERGIETGKKKLDWSLTLIAVAYTLAMILPGMLPVKILFARGKYGWGPEETGEWITYIAGTRVVLLVLIVPFIVKYLRRPVPTPLRPRPEMEPDNIESVKNALAWEAEAATLKKTADTVFDLSMARWSSLITIIGYLIASIPSPTSSNFLISTAVTSPSAVVIPSLQSLALAVSPPDDAGKVLACMSALATFTSSTVGPSLFAAVYIFSVERWAELIFVVGALWVSLSLVPLLLVRVRTSRITLVEDHDE